MDLKPFKTAFLNAIKRWSMTFKKHLLERVVNNLADLNSFIERADEGLMQQVKEGDYQNLINVMGILQVHCHLSLRFSCMSNLLRNKNFLIANIAKNFIHFRVSKKSKQKQMQCLSLWEKS